MSDIILIEYFTSRAVIKLENKKIFSEASTLVKSIIESFTLNKKLGKIYVIQNSKFNIKKNKKVIPIFTNRRISLVSILKKLPEIPVILIAPETKKISINLQIKISKFVKLKNSNLETMQLLSSKYETISFLKNTNISHVGIAKGNEKAFVVKKNYSTGSETTKLSKDYKSKSSEIIQPFYSGVKGSFSMLCLKKKFILISCNKQIVKINRNGIKQIGIIVGGLEGDRKELECLAKDIFLSIKGLFGMIGVDIIKYNGMWHVLEINPRFTSSFNGVLDCYGEQTVEQITNLYLDKELKFNKPTLRKTKKIYF